MVFPVILVAVVIPLVLVGVVLVIPLCILGVIVVKKCLEKVKSFYATLQRCSKQVRMAGLGGEYRTSEKINELLRNKHGPHIFIVGSRLDEIRHFWQHVGYKADGTIGEPREVSKTIVDIDCKSHGNYAEESDCVSDKNNKPIDWFDEFKITSKKSQDVNKSKSYTLQTSTTRGFNIGGNAGLKASSGFFNIAGGGVIPELGINASYHSDTTKMSSETESQDTKLSQAYEIIDDLHVPPKKRVEAKITTWAVTYEAKTTLRYTVDSNIFLPVKYRTHLSRVLGGFFVSTEYFSSREIFKDETGFRVIGNNVTFTREATVSYIGEQVEIKKRKDDLE